ncbi:hypothetical protein FACS189472_15090 [Alphaproteobacteria bacterium]|nr:hypothetical protein FACS189472_15090 [Alphaproteobacteria bacterium]
MKDGEYAQEFTRPFDPQMRALRAMLEEKKSRKAQEEERKANKHERSVEKQSKEEEIEEFDSDDSEETRFFDKVEKEWKEDEDDESEEDGMDQSESERDNESEGSKGTGEDEEEGEDNDMPHPLNYQPPHKHIEKKKAEKDKRNIEKTSAGIIDERKKPTRPGVTKVPHSYLLRLLTQYRQGRAEERSVLSTLERGIKDRDLLVLEFLMKQKYTKKQPPQPQPRGQRGSAASRSNATTKEAEKGKTKGKFTVPVTNTSSPYHLTRTDSLSNLRLQYSLASSVGYSTPHSVSYRPPPASRLQAQTGVHSELDLIGRSDYEAEFGVDRSKAKKQIPSVYACASKGADESYMEYLKEERAFMDENKGRMSDEEMLAALYEKYVVLYCAVLCCVVCRYVYVYVCVCVFVLCCIVLCVSKRACVCINLCLFISLCCVCRCFYCVVCVRVCVFI